MNKIFLSVLLMGSLSVSLNAKENNSTNVNAENNRSINKKKSTENNATVKEKRAKQQLEEQMKREEQYAKEQTFHQGKNYDLSSSEVDPNSLSDIPLIEPDYSFNMDDVYD